MNEAARLPLALGWAGYALLPWHLAERGAETGLVSALLAPERSGLVLGLTGHWWLLPIAVPLLLAFGPVARPMGRDQGARWLIIAGLIGLGLIAAQGILIGHTGWKIGLFEAVVGTSGPRQSGMNFGAGLTAFASLLLLCRGLAGRGWCGGDSFTISAIGLVVALIGIFVFFPVTTILASAFQNDTGSVAPGLFLEKFTDRSIWGLDCLVSDLRCGVAWNTLFLATIVGVSATALGLAFALIATRTGFPLKRALRVITIIPIITPPFVIGLAIILLFGRTGAASTLLYESFGIPRTRWVYGLPGVALAQILAFTPLAFLLMVGIIQGISPSLEEAAQTLRARRWTVFRTVSLPLMRPGLANAFLLCFVESMADFGNPLVLGGNYEVLSTKIFFAVVGAAHDQGRAAVLAIVLLGFTLGAFFLQHAWLGKKVYVTVGGKGDSGISSPLPRPVSWLCFGVALPWALMTAVIYVVILAGGFVRSMGRDYTPTLDHFITGFRIENTEHGLFFSGSAWDSFFSTLKIAAISAPLTAALGLLTAWLLTRQAFAGRRIFEFGTLLSFAIPGTVVGVSYILAFNVPPVEITGTAFILVMCFVFRNMPVGVRSGIAALKQIDKSLDEASLTLGAGSSTTLRRIVLPLLRPALVAALVYSFVRAMTSVSAVIFLVTPTHNMATAYIVGRVEAGEFGLAIAYSSTLIVVMLLAILAIQVTVGERRLGRRIAAGSAIPATSP